MDMRCFKSINTLKRTLALFCALVFALSSVGCSDGGSSSADSGSSPVSDDSSKSRTDSGDSKDADSKDADSNAAELLAVSFSGGETEVTEERFLSGHTSIVINAPENATVYYTTDGSIPDEDSEVYTEPITLKAGMGDFPECLLLRAKAVYQDGTESETVTHTFFASFDIDTRFSNPVFSICADPDDLFNKPDGLFYGRNYELRGRESERQAYIEALNSDGSVIFEQGAGIRIFGAASRESSIKSLKLFARKEYDPDHGKFALDIFQTNGVDGQTIDKYDKLVLRNAGNDFQFAYIRDELNQRLALKAGYTDCEGVVPAVVYLNGEYYGLLWLHETFCDDLLKDKYGGELGKYEVIEGKETVKKTDDDDEDNVKAATEFNETYDRLAYADLTDDSEYQKVCEFMDVENYLDNYAFNIYVNNFDWPQNNYKCYRYYAGEGEEYGSGATDGRWRFLLHDTDYCMDLYQQDVTAVGYNNIAEIMNPYSERYSPMFTALMERDDCREYFLGKIKELMDGALSADSIEQTLDEMTQERYSEMKIYYKHLEKMKKSDQTIWSWYENYLEHLEEIKVFARKRKGYVKGYLIDAFGLDEDYFG